MQLLTQAEEKGILSPPMASTIKAKLQHAGSKGLQALTCYEAGLAWQALPLGDLVQFWAKHFEVQKCRRLLIGKRMLPVVAFTDGAVETVDGALVVTIGGVLFDPLSNKPPSFFLLNECKKRRCKNGPRRTRGTRSFRLRSSR